MAAPFPSPTSTWHDNSYPSIAPTRPELSAEGKSVIITGGGTGIGAETARSFAAAGAARISILGRREQPLLDTKASIEREYPKVDVLFASADIADPKSINAAFEQFTSGAKNIDVLVSNAAVTGPMEPINDANAEEFMKAVNINVGGSVTVAKAFLQHAAADAVVIDVNSFSAHLAVGGAFASYAVAKLAQFQVWKYVGLANPKLRVYHIQPGVVDTDMNRKAGGVAAMGFEDHVSLPAHFSVWLASPEAGFLNGKFLWANWDVDELKKQSAELEGTSKLDITLVGWPFEQNGFEVKVTDTSASHWKS